MTIIKLRMQVTDAIEQASQEQSFSKSLNHLQTDTDGKVLLFMKSAGCKLVGPSLEDKRCQVTASGSRGLPNAIHRAEGFEEAYFKALTIRQR